MPLCTNCMKQVKTLRTLSGTRGKKQVCKLCFYAISFGQSFKQKQQQKFVKCFQCGNQTPDNGFAYTICRNCSFLNQAQAYQVMYTILGSNKIHTHSFFGHSFADLLGDEEMPKATLSYEALQLDQEGNVVEGAYKIKLEGNFKQHIEPIVKFIKATIPSSERTYDPSSFEWFYHEKWHHIMQTALQGSRFMVNYVVTKEAFTELKRKQAEWAKQAGQTFQTKQYDTSEDMAIFGALLSNAAIETTNYIDWTKAEADKAYKKAIRFYHPDLHPERAEQASSLNEIWSRLKEGYYIK